MSCVLPFDIIVLIIDIVGENKDTNLLKELALVSHSFLQICSKHLFATVELYDDVPERHVEFVKLLKNRPNFVKYIRKLTYKVGYQSLQFSPIYASFDNDSDDHHLLSSILPDLHRTISCLNCLTIIGSPLLDWNSLDSSLKSAFLHLMRLPTVNHIYLSFIQNFPLSSLTLSVNLHQLDIFHLSRSNSPEEDGRLEIFVLQSEMMPNIREFHTSWSALLTTKLLHAKMQDGRPAFNFMNLRRLSMSLTHLEDERNIRFLLQNAKLLENLHLSVGRGRSLVDILSLSARTLKVLDLSVSLYDNSVSPPLAGLCEELEAMAGHNMLEALSFKVSVDGDETEGFIGSGIQKVEKVLVNPGWSSLRQVSFKVSIACSLPAPWQTITEPEVPKNLQSLPDKYLNHLSKLESVAFNYSAYVHI